MSFTAPKFTNAGRQLQTRVIAGDMLTFTTIKLGDGTMTTEPIAALTDLIHGIITLPVHEVRRNADYADVTGVFQNAGLSSGFYWREIGIFAADPDYPNDRSHDILYCYQNAAELAEYIPSASSAVIEKIIRVACVVGDAENITVGLASQAYAKAEDLQALEEQHSKDVERINNALDTVDPTKITAKAAPADGDGVMIADSADGGKAKRLPWLNVKAALGKLFVPLARKINGKTLTEDVTLTAADIKMPDSEEDVGAAMAKRLKDCGELSGQNDADVLTGPGFYRGGDTSKMLLHAPIISFAWTLEVLANSAWNVGVTQRFIDFETRRMFIRSNHPLEGGWVWYDWVEVAQCKTPDYHALSLADGIQSHGTAVYWKDQFNVVSIIFDYGSKKSGSFIPDDWELLATLPEGFRPYGDNWRMCDDSESGSAVATCRVSANGELRFRASAQSQHLNLFGHIYITYIAMN